MIDKIDFGGGGNLAGCFGKGPGRLESCTCPVVAGD